MQTPLITNFSRGVLSPKFHGRVDTEIYQAGAAELKNFIVNNQGSIQRRTGTYRIWNTGFTSPSPAGSDEGRFLVDVLPNQRYSLLLLNDGGDQAQFIISVGGESPQHRFFELESGAYSGDVDLGLFVLSEEQPDPLVDEFYPRASSFDIGSSDMVDDAYISTIGDITFLRTRDPFRYEGYKARVWHSTISRDKAIETTPTNPFVKIGPLLPPNYRKERSTLDHSVGFQIYEEDNTPIADGRVVISTKQIPQFVGQKVTGQYTQATQSAKLFIAGGIRNIAQDTGISDYGYVAVPVSNSSSSYRFYKYYPGRAKLYAAGRTIASSDVSVNSSTSTVRISFDGLRRCTANWGSLTAITVRRAKEERECGHWSPFSSVCFDWEDVWKTKNKGVALPAGWLSQYKNRTYLLEAEIPVVATSDYKLFYVQGSVREEIDSSKYTMNEETIDAEQFYTSITILNEAAIHPKTGVLPDANAFYEFERVPNQDELDQDIIARRVKPWVRTEVSTDNSLEYESNQDDWFNTSLDTFEKGKNVSIHNGRLMLMESEQEISFTVSALKDYVNFYEGDSEVDAYKLKVETDRKERIQWVLSVREGVIIGTDRNEYVVMGVESPSSAVSRRYTGFGSSRPYAIRFGDKILFVSRDSKRIMAYSYSDELAAWYSEDITSITEHFFGAGIQSMHYMEEPISSIWVVPEGNNGLLCLTWEDATGVRAWTQHMEGTNVLAASVVTISNKTGMVMAVDRGGKVVIEGMDISDDGVLGTTHYMDSAEYIPFSRASGSTDIIGPDGSVITENITIDFGTGRWARFQNKIVSVTVNGVSELILEDDTSPTFSTSITVGPFEGADVQFEINEESFIVVGVGIPFKSNLKTLPILVQSPSGAGVFKNTQIQKVRVRINESRQFLAGNSPDDMTIVELEGQDEVVYDEVSQRWTGDADIGIQSRWMGRPTLYLESYYADPLNVLALMIDSQVYE